ncbi:MAG: GNAT family N-acetyltransferase [Saprospiraceae bacterium]
MKIFLETERLILREILPSDATNMLALDANPNVLQYIGIQPVTNLETCRKTIRFIRDQYERNGIGRWAVVRKDTLEFIGWAGLKFVNEMTVNGHRNFYDLGYRFLEKHWGQGFGYESAQAIVNYGFNTLDLPKISAYLSPQNIGAKKILENCGLQFVESFEEDGVFYDWMEIVK